MRLEIHHPPWKRQGADADIRRNTMTMRLRIDLGDGATLVHFAERQDLVAWPITNASP